MAHIFAYLDPGAGSIILQMILAGVLGLTYTIKTYWRRIVRYARKGKKDDSVEAEAHSAEEHP